ncbi:hypothetical protein B0H19DRAFT_1068652 [Mycena capillaripes]|nr:hypothetical protein B0H19DRAFT_1068652 [Mycena capillaripes]
MSRVFVPLCFEWGAPWRWAGGRLQGGGGGRVEVVECAADSNLAGNAADNGEGDHSHSRVRLLLQLLLPFSSFSPPSSPPLSPPLTSENAHPTSPPSDAHMAPQRTLRRHNRESTLKVDGAHPIANAAYIHGRRRGSEAGVQRFSLRGRLMLFSPLSLTNLARPASTKQTQKETRMEEERPQGKSGKPQQPQKPKYHSPYAGGNREAFLGIGFLAVFRSEYGRGQASENEGERADGCEPPNPAPETKISKYASIVVRLGDSVGASPFYVERSDWGPKRINGRDERRKVEMDIAIAFVVGELG